VAWPEPAPTQSVSVGFPAGGRATLFPSFACDGARYRDSPCPLCGDPHRGVLLSQTGEADVPLHLVECNACGMMYSTPRIRAPHRLRLYRRWAEQKGTHALYDLAHQQRDRDLYAKAIRYLSPRLRGDSVLDCGCGGGLCLTLWRQRVPHLDVAGCSFDPREVRLARRLTGCRVRHLEDLQDEQPRRYAAITLFNVLEHVLDPPSLLRMLSQHLARTGLLLVVVPNTWLQRQRLRLSGRCDRNLTLHEHVNHFTPASLRRCLEMAGLRITAWLDDLPRGVEPAGTRRSLRQTLRHAAGQCLRRWSGRTEAFANLWAVATPATLRQEAG